jgi:integrase
VIYKKGRYYMVKFMWQGRMIRKSTRCTNAKDARTVEGTIRSELGKGNWGILKSKPRVTLAEFLREDFTPYAESTFQSAPKTRDYYHYGAKSLLESDLRGLRLDEITGQHAQQYAARLSATLEVSTINCGLRTLRRALNLAEEWGKLDRAPRISLAKGERQRERVLTDEEAQDYLAACPQPWRDVATVMLGTGMRPGECYCLRWEHVLLNGGGGLIQIAKGKSKAARRILPMVPAVFNALKDRHEAQGCPPEGWVFPSGSASGHLEESTAKILHDRALKRIRKAHEMDSAIPEVKPFEPYCLRHTALTNLTAAGCDAFTLARIAGHSSITITQRYCHPQADAIERAFARIAEGQKVVTDGGHQESAPTSR